MTKFGEGPSNQPVKGLVYEKLKDEKIRMIEELRNEYRKIFTKVTQEQRNDVTAKFKLDHAPEYVKRDAEIEQLSIEIQAREGQLYVEALKKSGLTQEDIDRAYEEAEDEDDLTGTEYDIRVDYMNDPVIRNLNNEERNLGHKFQSMEYIAVLELYSKEDLKKMTDILSKLKIEYQA